MTKDRLKHVPCIFDNNVSKASSYAEVEFYKQPRKLAALILAGVYIGDLEAPNDFADSIAELIQQFDQSVVSHNLLSFVLWISEKPLLSKLTKYYADAIKHMGQDKKFFSSQEELENWMNENEYATEIICGMNVHAEYVVHNYSNCSNALSAVLNSDYDKNGDKVVKANIEQYVKLLAIMNNTMIENYNDVRSFMLCVDQDIPNDVVTNFVLCELLKNKFVEEE